MYVLAKITALYFYTVLAVSLRMAKGVNSDTKREVYNNRKKSMSNKKLGLAKCGVT